MKYELEEKFLKKVVVNAYKTQIKNKKFSVENKENSSFNADFVTSCDRNMENYIIKKIKAEFPNDSIVSEEFNPNVECKGRCWVIDPIDGTVNFMRNIPLWCVQVAFVVNGKTELSVVFLPKLNELYSANESGAYLNGKKLEINKNYDISNSIFLLSDFESKSDKIYEFQTNMVKEIGKKCCKVKMLGSAGNDFSTVASSKAQLYLLPIVRNNIWDLYPGLFLCEKAGCEVFVGELFNIKLFFVCANTELKEYVKKIFKKYSN